MHTIDADVPGLGGGAPPRRWRFFALYTAPLLVYLAAIAVFSHADGARLPVSTEHDKLGHALEYTPVGLLMLRWLGHRAGYGVRGRSLLWAAALGILWGVSDEVHQAFVPHRSAEALDVAADGVGVVLGCLAYAGWARRSGRRDPAARFKAGRPRRDKYTGP